MKELQQLIDKKVWTYKFIGKLSAEERRKIITCHAWLRTETSSRPKAEGAGKCTICVHVDDLLILDATDRLTEELVVDLKSEHAEHQDGQLGFWEASAFKSGKGRA